MKKITISQQSSTFLICVLVSAFLWTIIKLSDEYTIQTTFKVCYVNVPSDKYMSENCAFNQKVTITDSGFKLIRYYLVRISKRVVKISLAEIPYRYENEYESYSYSGRYVCQAVADFLGVSVNGISISDNTIYFNMQNLKMKRVPVELNTNLTFQKQNQLYSKPVITPDSVDIFGYEKIVDTISSIKTELITATNINKDFTRTVRINLLDGLVNSTTETVDVFFDVEPFTEANYDVKVRSISDEDVRFFPEQVSVKCMVPLKDYPSINNGSFTIMIDEDQLANHEQLLRYRIVNRPSNVNIIKCEPEEIEYIIIQ